MRRMIVAVAVAAAFGAGCGGDDGGSTSPEATDSPDTKAEATTTVPAPTTDAPTTTEAVFAISHETAVLATTCLEDWAHLQVYGEEGFVPRDDFESMQDTCDDAATSLDVDLISDPDGAGPARTLALVLATIKLVASIEKLDLLTAGCDDKYCDIALEKQDTFLQLEPGQWDGVPPAFEGFLGLDIEHKASLESIDGLVVAA